MATLAQSRFVQIRFNVPAGTGNSNYETYIFLRKKGIKLLKVLRYYLFIYLHKTY